ncbi:Holliday junction DNA helicase RuvA [Thermosinus carboxydivorans Nor1]|uniref:Holliday junction branch migration complex subunit RuvA n=1 Tax=Thermosinus carboxydivorans Nor1 TaxID=401526 RepID=A1HT75_9FIRM|nr:Holliday junction branch migration protein RuvA [Thermosinus carboxydivorans]EAX46754.1 Holliday junction DNA helicase RuvA [Thermosinus carboxydivorans Nor1]
MIGYLRGTVVHLGVDHCILDVNGVGYRVFVPASGRQRLVAGAQAALFTYLHVREDALLLYGFHTQDEYELFLLLMDVSGIGPKAALNILSAVSPEGFRLAVSQKNVSLLTKIPGIGKKTAERIILELKDKVGTSGETGGDAGLAATGSASAIDQADEALQAMLALGYSHAEVAPVLKKVRHEAQSVEELIRLVLREFTRRS